MLQKLVALMVLVFSHQAYAAEGPAPSISFTAQERAYIERSGVVKMCVDPDWVPFEHLDEKNQHQGIGADLVQLVAQRVGLKIEVHPVQSWDESLLASKSKQCQIMSFLNQTPARDQWLIFTEPIFYDPNVIITREEHALISDLHGVTRSSVALPRGTMVAERILSTYPNLTLIPTDSEPEAMALVSARKADMTIRSLIVAAHTIKKEGLFNLKIAGQIPEMTNYLRIGVLKDEPILRSILDKGVRTITPQEREAISNKHVAITVQRGIDYGLVWKVLAGSAVLLMLAFYWNRKLSALNKELERLSVTDKLTGLYNRMKLDESLEREIDRTHRFGEALSVIMLDIDHFKDVNDHYGHQAGDRVLQAVAALLQKNTRETDVVGRWGGEEFIIICPHTDAAGVLKLAEALRQTFESHEFPFVTHKTASFGVTSYQHGDLARNLIARADQALYAAKNNGRNRVEISSGAVASGL